MCLVTLLKNSAIRTAKKDLHTYKICKSNLISPYEYFQYRLNRLFVEPEFSVERMIDASDTSFWNSVDTKYYKKYPSERLAVVVKGFHSVINEELLVPYVSNGLPSTPMQYTLKVYDCIIPKDSLYLVNELGMAVSNQIIIVGESLNFKY